MSEKKSKMIAGESFEITVLYAAGHVLTEAEAKTLNQVRAENIGNNVREAVKKLIEEGNVQGARDLVAEKDATYEFTLASASAAVKLDPVEREARSIAKDLVKAKLAAQGLKFNVPKDGETKESWAEKMEANVDKFAQLPEVVAAAKKAVDAKKKRMDSLAALEV